MIKQEELKKYIAYDKDTGIFYSTTNEIKQYSIGSVLGKVTNKGYVKINLKGKTYVAHKLAYLYESGEYPVERVYHRNGNKLDNRFDNLKCSNEYDEVTQEYLKRKYIYDCDSGTFADKETGELRGGIDKDGYCRVKLEGQDYKVHRLAWLYVYGEWPIDIVDHIDHNRSNNAISNLRVVTAKENAQNRKLQSRNNTGDTGVHWGTQAKKWIAAIGVDGKKIHLGYFIEYSEAVNARKLAEIAYGFHENHGKDL